MRDKFETHRILLACINLQFSNERPYSSDNVADRTDSQEPVWPKENKRCYQTLNLKIMQAYFVMAKPDFTLATQFSASVLE